MAVQLVYGTVCTRLRLCVACMCSSSVTFAHDCGFALHGPLLSARRCESAVLHRTRLVTPLSQQLLLGSTEAPVDTFPHCCHAFGFGGPEVTTRIIPRSHMRLRP